MENSQSVKKYLPIPNGYKKYRFNVTAMFETSMNPAPETTKVYGLVCVFECVASSERKAREKYYDAVETVFELATAVTRNNPKRS